MILVTGAAGKTGRQVIRRLCDMGMEVRALVRTPEQIGPLLESGARAAVPADLLKVEDVSRAMDGVRAVYHICPNVHPQEVEIGDLMIEVSRAAEVDRFVFHSVLHPEVEAMPHHWLKHQVERKLVGSGLTFSILQPCAYMQNLCVHLPNMMKHGTLEAPYDIEAKLSLVDLRDVAECAAAVLSEPGHEGRTYELCGPEAISHTRMARAFESALGRPVEAVSVDPAEWERKARSSGLGDYAVAALMQMFRWYDRNGFVGSPGDLESLLTRPANSFADFVAEVLA